MWWAVLLALFLPFCFGMGGGPPSGDPPKATNDFVLNFDSDVYVCEDEASKAFIDTSSLRAVRYNETAAIMSGSFKFLKGLGPQTMLELIISKEASGRLEVVATHEICDLCEELGPKDEETMYTNYLAYIGFPDFCPIEPGDYPVHDLMTDTQEMPINAANVGKYLITINFYYSPEGDCKKDLEFLGCIKLDMVIERQNDA